MDTQIWSFILSAVDLLGFFLAGKRIWWSWYINIFCQLLWFTYALITQQYGFLIAAFAYSFIFIQNAYKWTKEHFEEERKDKNK